MKRIELLLTVGTLLLASNALAQGGPPPGYVDNVRYVSEIDPRGNVLRFVIRANTLPLLLFVFQFVWDPGSPRQPPAAAPPPHVALDAEPEAAPDAHLVSFADLRVADVVVVAVGALLLEPQPLPRLRRG